MQIGDEPCRPMSKLKIRGLLVTVHFRVIIRTGAHTLECRGRCEERISSS